LAEKVFRVDGMTCEHCQERVTKAIRTVAGVSDVKVSLEAASAEVTYDPGQATSEAIGAAVAKAGYRLSEA